MEPRASAKVIAVTTLKGGSGKTTLAVCLAALWQLRGKKTAIIDADPQCSSMRWVSAGASLSDLRLEALPDRKGRSAEQLITELKGKGLERIVVDTAGFRSEITPPALRLADLALIPVRPSPVDFSVAADTVDWIRELDAQRSRPLPTWCVMSQAQARTVIAQHVRSELTRFEFPVLKSQLIHRVIHAEAVFTGATPSILQPYGAAAQEIAAILDEVEALLEA